LENALAACNMTLPTLTVPVSLPGMHNGPVHNGNGSGLGAGAGAGVRCETGERIDVASRREDIVDTEGRQDGEAGCTVLPLGTCTHGSGERRREAENTAPKSLLLPGEAGSGTGYLVDLSTFVQTSQRSGLPRMVRRVLQC
jgi:hypothetical protein